MKLSTLFSILLISFAFNTSSKATSIETSSNFSELQSCLEKLHNGGFTDDLSIKCYQLSLPFANYDSIIGRALYLQALDSYLVSDSRSSFNANAKRISTYYHSNIDSQITPQSIDTFNMATLHAISKTLSMLHFSADSFFETINLNKYRLIFTELEKRKAYTFQEATWFYQTLIKSNQWDEAQAMRQRIPSIDSSPLPMVQIQDEILPQELGYYSLSPDLKFMTLKRFDFEQGAKIIINANCHFAFDAIKALNNYPDIQNIMRNIGLVVGDYDFLKYDSLKKQYPNFEIHPLHQAGSWFKKGIDVSGSPSFLFVINGIEKYRFSGYREYLVSDFCRGIKAIGQTLPSTCPM